MDFFHCISFKDAQRRIAAIVGESAAVETSVLPACLGRIAAVDVKALEDIPPFDRSSVDGFAVRSSDTFGAAEGIPVLLQVVGEIRMGQSSEVRVGPGHAVVIPTGGALPQGADCVVMVEDTECPDDHSVLVFRPASPGENVIRKGEDFGTETVLLQRGQRILPADIGALAACGHTEVAVWTRPVIGLISTGDEIVDIGNPTAPGQIRDINSYVLGAMLEEAGCTVRRLGIVADEFAALRAAVSEALGECQMIVLSGGSSVGARDQTADVIRSFDQSEIVLHGIAMKPGKPTIVGVIGDVPIFGLPGHPAAAMVVCEQLVKPAAFSLLGARMPSMRRCKARFARNAASAPGRDDFIRVRLSYRDGEYWAEPIFGKSGLLRTMLEADGIVHIRPEQSGISQNEVVEVELLQRR